jgi:hypothetical protein
MALTLAASLTACARREEPTARELGRETYQAGENIKKGAKKAAKEIRDAGKEFGEGWSEARRKDNRNSKRPEQ